MTSITRRHALAGATAVATSFALPAVVRGQGKVTVRWGESLPPNHPQVQMAERIAKDVREKSAGRIEIQIFPSGQLGTGADMIESVSSWMAPGRCVPESSCIARVCGAMKS
jgi:TRAP-type C4-dicarboxylate transport system substrate-binding protein